MLKKIIVVAISTAVFCTGAFAANQKYQQKLELSGCTQVSEMEGCDINKTKAENAKAGFGSAPATSTQPAAHNHTRNLLAVGDEGNTVATIRIQAGGKVLVNDKAVTAKHTGAALHFQQGMITFTVTDDPAGKSFWMDTDAGTKGMIKAQ